MFTPTPRSAQTPSDGSLPAYLRLDDSVALGVLGVAGTDGEASTAVGLVGAFVVLDVTGAAEGSADVQEVIVSLNDEASSTFGDSGRGDGTDWKVCVRLIVWTREIVCLRAPVNVCRF